MSQNKTIIDAHIHLGLSPDGGFSDVDTILKNMEMCHISKTVIFAIDVEDRGETFHTINSQVLDAYNKHPDKFIPFARIDPSAGEAAVVEFKRCVKSGVRGLKLKASDGFSPQDASIILDLINTDKPFPVLMHTSHEGESTPKNWEPIIKSYPNINFIMAHGGKDHYRMCGQLAADYANLYVETSTLSYHRTMVIHSMSGANKLIFASDYPYSHPALELDKYELFIKDEEELHKIYYKNISLLLGSI